MKPAHFIRSRSMHIQVIPSIAKSISRCLHFSVPLDFENLFYLCGMNLKEGRDSQVAGYCFPESSGLSVHGAEVSMCVCAILLLLLSLPQKGPEHLMGVLISDCWLKSCGGFLEELTQAGHHGLFSDSGSLTP